MKNNNIVTRRSFLLTSASAAGFAILNRPLLAQMSLPGLSSDPAALALEKAIGRRELTDLESRFRTVNDDICARGLRSIPGISGTFLTGYPYNEFYDWDLYFENLYLSYFGVWPYCFTNLKAFLDRQRPDGYVNRSLIKQRDRQHFKPFLAQLALLGCKQDGNNFAWLRGNYYVRLKKYLEKWFSYDGDGNGLPVWNSADAAGTDNQWSRAGALSSFSIEGSDLASYLVRELRAMSVIARKLGEPADGREFDAHADRLCALINQFFWDEADGMYYDRDERNGRLVKVKSATCFMPLFAGAATPERAKRIVHEHLLNEKEFWLSYPVASYAKTEPDYYQGSHHECNWRGPTWAPTNYMIFQGLRRYGFDDSARELAARLLDMALVKNPVLREYYNAETGEGLGQTRFWGFTGLYYGMLLESYAGYDASSLDKPSDAIVARTLGVVFPESIREDGEIGPAPRQAT
jgi:hypothetical protein